MSAFGFLLAFWIIATSFVSLKERIRHFKGGLATRLGAQPRAYYGMLLAHLGIAVFIIGVTGVKSFETERDVRMDVGDTVNVGGYDFRFQGVRDVQGPNYTAAQGVIEVRRNGKFIEVLHPEKRLYTVQQAPMTEAAIDSGVLGDLYVSLGEPVADTGAWAVRLYDKPMVTWIWGGCVLMALGGFMALIDRRYRVQFARQAAAANTATA